MTWTRIPDNWPQQIEAAELSHEAERLAIRALVECNAALTDGHLSKAALRRVGVGFRSVSKLTAELCEKFDWKPDGKGGFHVPWGDQEAAADVQKRQEASRERNRRYRRKGDEMRAKRDASRDASRDGTPALPVHSRPVLEEERVREYEGADAALDPDRAGALPGSLRSAPGQGRAQRNDQQPARKADPQPECARQHADAAKRPPSGNADGRTGSGEGEGLETAAPIAQEAAEDEIEYEYTSEEEELARLEEIKDQLKREPDRAVDRTSRKGRLIETW